jgi:hypothetical protein
MNIFVTNTEPIRAACELDDKRVKHMPKECVELLAMYIYDILGYWVCPVPLWNHPGTNRLLTDLRDTRVYAWVKKDKYNVNWLKHYTCALMNEYKFRFGKEHEFNELLKATILPILPFDWLTNNLPTTFANATPFKHEKDVTMAYKLYLMKKWTITDKLKPPVFTKRGEPEWFNLIRDIYPVRSNPTIPLISNV